mgnify:CR=1 FL=1
MAGKLVELPEAAKILGVSSDELMEMRQRGEIHGYRDGASWKFKQEEIDRVLAERGGGGEASSSQFDETFDHLMPTGSGDEDSGSEADSISILVSEEALGKPPETTSSTIIGRKKPHDSSPSESDITLGWRGFRRILSVNGHCALIGLFKTGNEAQQGCFARTCGAEQHNEFAIANRERHIINGACCAKIFR